MESDNQKETGPEEAFNKRAQVIISTAKENMLVTVADHSNFVHLSWMREYVDLNRRLQIAEDRKLELISEGKTDLLEPVTKHVEEIRESRDRLGEKISASVDTMMEIIALGEWLIKPYPTTKGNNNENKTGK